jgi:hypothetical protein
LRTIFKLCLVAAMAAAVGLVAVPVASADTGAQGHASITKFEKKQNKKIKKAKNKADKAHERIENLKDWNDALDAHNRRQDSDLQGIEGTLNAIVAGVPDIIGGLTALQSALEDEVAPALTAINDALTDPVTGLLGLNLARPQFGVFEGTGNFLGGTGTVASGPDDDAVRLGAGTYVVDFNNDVSSRALTVQVAPTGGVGLTTAAVNCLAAAANPTIDGACDAAAGGDPATPHPDLVFVLLQTSSTGAATDGTFTITALSG